MSGYFFNVSAIYPVTKKRLFRSYLAKSFSKMVNALSETFLVKSSTSNVRTNEFVLPNPPND